MIVQGCRKLRNKPSLDFYDNRSPKAGGLHQTDQVAPNFKASLALEKEYPSTRVADKALLVSLGVNGEVPLAQAMVNAAEKTWAWQPGFAPPAMRLAIAANDNYAVSAKAA